MKWIKTCDGQFINLDHVAQFSFQRRSDPNDYQIEMYITYPDERRETHTIFKSHYADLDDMVINQHDQFCPSPPGYFVLSYYKEDEDSEEIVSREAILGWVLDTELDGYHHVVTTWSNYRDFGPTTAILCADGSVVVPGSNCYHDEKSWLEAMRQRPIEKAA